MSNTRPPLSYKDATPSRPYLLMMVTVLLTLALFGAGFAVGYFDLIGHASVVAPGSSAQSAQFAIFWEAWKVIERQFYHPAPPDYRAMTYGAIRGMLESLGDPYTVFVAPSQHRLERDEHKGEFGGIGLQIALEDEHAVLIGINMDSPAGQAGLQQGDVLLAVDGRDASALTLEEIEVLLRGQVGSSVQLDVQREGQQRLSFILVRERIELPSLSWKTLQDGRVGYVHIQRFTERTSRELARALQSLREQRACMLVLDLRGDGGGLVQSAVEVVGQFIDYGLAYRELNKDGKEQGHSVPLDNQKTDWPLVVLVDGGTASSAEIVAAAIQDHGRGVLIGTPTFGKGSVQSIIQLSDDSSVHVTSSRWLSPHGHAIDGLGLQPDLWVLSATDAEGHDVALQRAVEYLEHKLSEMQK